MTSSNVEKVLDMLRPHLRDCKKYGGNVRLVGIDGRVVKLKLEGGCETCPSSEITMKMGLEAGLKRMIPEIRKVVQVFEDEKELTSHDVEKVLNGIRPILRMSGGSIEMKTMASLPLQTMIVLELKNPNSDTKIVQTEIQSRIMKEFPGRPLRIEWL